MEVSFATVQSPLGYFLVASHADKICWVSMSTQTERLEKELRHHYPLAVEKPECPLLRDTGLQLMEYLAGHRKNVDVPTTVEPTSFQWKVWNGLSSIPYGETRTYTEVAAMIGHPKAARAVGAACASNPLAIIIPCHRVVSLNGELGGYRWGVPLKKAILEMEQSVAGITPQVPAELLRNASIPVTLEGIYRP